VNFQYNTTTVSASPLKQT